MLESGVEFAVAAMPDANRMTLHILAAIAEGESKEISERTRAALQVAKARGVKLGTNKPLTPEQRANGVRRSAQSRRAQAVEMYCDLTPMVKSMRSEGATLAAIAEHLNAEGHTTRTGRNGRRYKCIDCFLGPRHEALSLDHGSRSEVNTARRLQGR